MAKPIDLTPKITLVSYENETLVEVPAQFSDFFGGQSINTPTVVRQNHIESSNFISGSAGWRLDAEGNLEANSGIFRGDLEAGTINIPNSTNPLFSVDSAGNMTAISATILNAELATIFEASGRFQQVVTGSGSVTFNTLGVVIRTGTTTASTAFNRWSIFGGTDIFLGLPVFSATITINVMVAVNTDDIFYFGPGDVGSPPNFVTNDHAGFKVVDGALIATQSDGVTETVSGTLETVVSGDSLDIVIKIKSASIEYYYRLNSGSFTLGAILTTNLPNTTSSFATFVCVNTNSTTDIRFSVSAASYSR